MTWIILAIITNIFARETQTYDFYDLWNRYPSNYDWRYKPSSIKCKPTIPQEGICLAGSWAQAFAAVLSALRCLSGQQYELLSAQQLIDCSGNSQACDQFNSQDFLPLGYLQDKGITTNQCYKYSLLNSSPKQCKQICDNGEQFKYRTKANQIQRLNNTESVIKHLYQVGPLVAIIQSKQKFIDYDEINYSLGDIQGEGKKWGLRGVIVYGWKQTEQGKQWIVSGTMGKGLGSVGDLFILQSSEIVQSFYSITL